MRRGVSFGSRRGGEDLRMSCSYALEGSMGKSMPTLFVRRRSEGKSANVVRV